MREDFHGEMDRLVDRLLSMGDTVVTMLDRAVDSLVNEDAELANEVIRADDGIDSDYADVQSRVVRVMALQAPVASDLRLLSAMLHVNIHLERMGDYALNVAKMGKWSAPYKEDVELAGQLREMASIAMEVGRSAIASFGRLDVEAAQRLPGLDDGVDDLNIGLFRRLVERAARDERYLEWATRMILVSRQIERYGDHGVDIGEATIFAVTGDMIELSSNAPDRTGGPYRR
ncbi:MAG: phosphate signaling complex protein PhoU [Nitriliruptorales bacterium]